MRPVPHKPGEIWNPAIHGVQVRSSAHWESLYKFDEAALSKFFEVHGFPIEDLIPQQVFQLVHQAFSTERRATTKPRAEVLAVRDEQLAMARGVLDAVNAPARRVA